ncbi:PhzF family phenazine biosynthesis protein [Mannheimia haemolytica]|uniref:PhzF family phenazine biosynthesis protein n=1 Tax=Mannheimia haemolytica TaxID=75985 RepID=UPI00038683B3|nr:PhzF family phenazine biosynthesis protein [Mannheimia haemolytica]EPZ00440.1 isomerase [Mannheimia haemolytica D35]MDW1150682.1 PhzF family phenazine biosynthesis protein [Mannheimia haemolytica]MDW1160840.1 PhzF family phenazine biosynthesis protein [Mannheimia haemolytica]TRC50077.1 PhzF family phenazine biosynthesis protein [Mannheimia haemolytica]TRC50262.1 PhzF family phenazine biosynthesis protein [Mannheimia haemolytica]
MQSYPYLLVNVFATSHFGGNPLAIFYEADGLTDLQMQLIARQFNLSEVVFIQSSTDSQAVKKLKIFTPDYEMPFAGHPTVGAAFVLHSAFDFPTTYRLQTNAGLVAIQHQHNVTTFALTNGVNLENTPLSRAECASILGLNVADIASEPCYVNTGVEQLLVELASQQAVEKCKINANLAEKAFLKDSVYVWCREGNEAKVRLFFQSQGSIVEDPGTGSAAANLGGWHIAQGKIPIQLQISQGDEIQRPNRLLLKVDQNEKIFVGGEVILVGKGEFYLPE